MASRRSNIRPRGKSWVVYYRRDGKQHWRSFKTKDEAELELARVNLRRAQDQPEPTARRMTLGEHAREWLEHKSSRVGRQTLVNYESVLRVHVLPSLGHLELRRIGRKTLDDFVSDWADGGPMFRERVGLAQQRERERAQWENRPSRPIRLGRSPKTIGNAVVVLSALFKDAVAWERLAASPAVALTRPRDDRPADERMRPLDADGLRSLVAAADGPLARALLLTAAMTGARRGELLGLRWSDIDYANGRIWIRRSIGIGGEVKKPKTAKSVRPVALPRTLRDELEAWWKQSSHRGPDEYVFASSTGTPLDARGMIRDMFEPARKKANLGMFRFHDLRHSYASILIAQGEHPKVISEQLGHASVTITMDTYSHLFDRAWTDVSDSLERAWKAAETTSGRANIEEESAAASLQSAGVEEELPATKIG